MNNAPTFQQATPVGQNALHRLLGGMLPLPTVQSYLATGPRREREEPPYSLHFYPAHLAPGDMPLDHLRFALKNEPLDLGIVYAALRDLIDPDQIEAWVRKEPTGSLSRRAWFFYELLTGKTLNVPSVGRNVPYTEALDPKHHFTAASVNSTRHRVRNNLLGGVEENIGMGFYPLLRRTPLLEAQIGKGLAERASALLNSYPADVITSAISYLYTRETRSSFEIEGEKPTRSKEQRFLLALEKVADFQPNKEALITLQNTIVDSSFTAKDWRHEEVFVGERIRDYEKVHFIAARPADVDPLMTAWRTMTERLVASPDLDPVLAAAVSAFAFVFIHPFDDGNGRIHRFLIHYVLAQKGFTAPGILFPVSTAIVKRLPAYYAALETFSGPALKATDWEWQDDYTISTLSDTRDLYRFFDATPLAEFLYEMVDETIDLHLQSELEYLSTFYKARAALNEAFDLPNKDLNRLTREILDNQGRLSNNKRKQLFPYFTDEQVVLADTTVQAVMKPAMPARNPENNA